MLRNAGRQKIFTKKRILLIAIAITAAIVLTEAYINSPKILLWLNPNNSVSLTAVYFPQVAYRGENLPITICLSNTGDAKDVLVEVASMDSPILSSNIQLGGSSQTGNTTIRLPLNIEGNQSFSIKVNWVGLGGFCSIQQTSTDKQFEVLAADYDCASPTLTASRAQGFEWTLSVINVGNTAANLTVQLRQNDPLILSDVSGGTAQINNIQVGQTSSVNFQFDVPSDASLGDHTITVSLTTTYPNIPYYKNCQEVTYQNFTYNIQESPIKTELDNANYLLGAALALVFTVVAFVAAAQRKLR